MTATPPTRFVAVAVPAPRLSTLTYRVPPELAHAVGPGARVRVPLGKRHVVGVVFEDSGPPGEGIEAKDVAAVLDDMSRPALPPDLLAVVRWIAEYYVAPPGDAIRAALPAALAPGRSGWVRLTASGEDAARGIDPPEPLLWLASRPGQRARRSSFLVRLPKPAHLVRYLKAGLVEEEPDEEAKGAPVTRRLVVAAPSALADLDATRAALARAPARLKALDAAIAGEPAIATELARRAGVSPTAVTALVRSGILAEQVVAQDAGAVPGTGIPVAPPPTLTAAQETAVGTLRSWIDAGAYQAALLFGVTGSGKTEVYLRAAEHTLARGRSVLVLVPEIGLTPQLAEALGRRFGDGVVVLHSGITDRQRYEAWHRARLGTARIVVGARSALFAPLSDIGLIVVDEEHDGGYKQEEAPRYHARDLALVRGRAAGAVVVLGSATPSMEAWSLVTKGNATLLELPDRVGGGTLPRTVMVDMREEFRETGRATALSRRLVQEIEATLARGEQAMVLLNRRGYSRSILCRACGEPVTCRSCSIALTWHRVGERLRCHYCGWSRPRPDECPSCRSPHLAEVGEGTQRAEEAIAAAVPRARIARMDRDSIRSSQKLADLLGSFARGEIDVLVGTQMIAKGHHFPNVTLVGVLSADAALRMPDFRAGERTFQLLTQVAGRAGRGDRPGTVVVQAFRPDHPALVAAMAQDFRAFAARETIARSLMRYPPAAALLNLVVRDEDQARAHRRAIDLAQRLREAGEGHVAVLGPTAAPLARVQDLWRVQILVRANRRRRILDAVNRALASLPDADGTPPRWLLLDVDPQNLL